MSRTRTDKQQFYSELKIIKNSNNRLISREHLELVEKYLSDQHQQNFSCDDDVDVVVAKGLKKELQAISYAVV